MATSSIRIGTRASALALWQAQWVAQRLAALDVLAEVVRVSTHGDRDHGPLESIGGQGVFTKTIQRELQAGRIDLAVHSLKDLPTVPVPGLRLAAVPPRAPAGDVLISAAAIALDQLPQGAVVGTGSPRRRAQLLHLRPDLNVRGIRGNVETRIEKLRRGDYDAIILAEAGVTRLELTHEITQRLLPRLLLPAVGQGALGLEIRSDDHATEQAVQPLDDPATHRAVAAERAMMRTLEGGCLAPVAAWGRLEDDQLKLTGRVLSQDGRQKLEVTELGQPTEPIELGRRIAEMLLQHGAAALIRQSHGSG